MKISKNNERNKIRTKLTYKIYCNYKGIFFSIYCFIFVFSFIQKCIFPNNEYIRKNHNKIIEENFFVIDSNNLNKIQSHMYGFTVSKIGILTDNYYKNKGYYEEPEPQGTYIMIRKIGNEIKIYQDFYGKYGLYIYENKNSKYFALSNSFLLLEEFLFDKQNISLNKDFSDNFVISRLCSPSIHETLINEIIKLPSNAIIKIDIKKKQLKLFYIDYKENTVPLESKEGLKIIDEWVDKWSYIFRSLTIQTDNFSFDLSGGFDTRTLLSILLSSGINLNKMHIKSAKDKKNPDHIEDIKIANDISLKFGFKLNNFYLDDKSTIWSTNDTLHCSMYSKLGFHKEFYWKDRFFYKPRFIFTGEGGENIRGYPGYPIKKYIEGISSQAKQIPCKKEIFYKSSMRLCKRSVDLLQKKKSFDTDYEISSALYSKGRTRNHYGKASVEGFLSNIYFLQPLIDPDIKKIKFNIREKWSHDLIAYIYTRFAHDLIFFPIQGNRIININSIQKAEKLNNKTKPYKIKTEINKNFYIDINRKSPAPQSFNNKNADDVVKELFKTNIQNIKTIYDNNIYEWALKYSKNTTFFPLRHIYGLLAISKTIEYLSLNEKYMKKSS